MLDELVKRRKIDVTRPASQTGKIYVKMLNPIRTLRCVNSQNLERNEKLGKDEKYGGPKLKIKKSWD